MKWKNKHVSETGLWLVGGSGGGQVDGMDLRLHTSEPLGESPGDFIFLRQEDRQAKVS